MALGPECATKYAVSFRQVDVSQVATRRGINIDVDDARSVKIESNIVAGEERRDFVSIAIKPLDQHSDNSGLDRIIRHVLSNLKNT